MDWRPRAVVIDLITDPSDAIGQQLVDRVTTSTDTHADVIVLCKGKSGVISSSHSLLNVNMCVLGNSL